MGKQIGRRVVGPGFHDRVFEVVSRIPSGRVAAYGDVAEMLGSRRVARQVGYALATLPADRDDVPWHRVVNAKGRISLRSDGDCSSEQVLRLKAEGVEVDGRGTVAGFAKLRWRLEG